MELKTVNVTAWIDHTAYGKITVPADVTDEQIWQFLTNYLHSTDFMEYDKSPFSADWRWAEWTTDAPFDDAAPKFIDEFKEIEP